jgi:steroid delta-isomerase-like uncharacterized protein
MNEPKDRQREFVEDVQGRGNIDRVDEFIAEDFVNHTPPPGVPANRDGARAIFQAIRSAFPDHDAEVVHVLGDGDLVATYKTFTGTHEGDFFGLPPTGRRATIRVMDVVRYRDGKIAEHWNIVDTAGLIAQLTGEG